MKVISKHQGGSLRFLQSIMVVLPRVLLDTDFYEIAWTSNASEAIRLTEEQARSLSQFIASLDKYHLALIVAHPAI